MTLEWSTDNGANWSTLASGEPDDGTYLWMVPASVGTGRRLRVRRYNRVTPTPAPYPAACSADGSNAAFTIAPVPPVAGMVPDSLKVGALRRIGGPHLGGPRARARPPATPSTRERCAALRAG